MNYLYFFSINKLIFHSRFCTSTLEIDFKHSCLKNILKAIRNQYFNIRFSYKLHLEEKFFSVFYTLFSRFKKCDKLKVMAKAFVVITDKTLASPADMFMFYNIDLHAHIIINILNIKNLQRILSDKNALNYL